MAALSQSSGAPPERGGRAAASAPSGGAAGKTGQGAASALAQLLQDSGAAPPGPLFAHNAAMTEQELTEAVRQACIQAALDAYEDAGISGLCAEGRWEAAISAMQSLDLKPIARGAGGPDTAQRR
jgi:hypothetical protein